MEPKTKVEKQNVLSFRYSTNNEADYILTLDGKEIGRVYELENVQMIEELCSRKAIMELEFKVEEQKEEIDKLESDLRGATKKLKVLYKTIADVANTIDNAKDKLKITK